MGRYVPPYIGTNKKKIEKKLFKAKKVEGKAKVKYEEAQQITQLWQDRLEEVTR